MALEFAQRISRIPSYPSRPATTSAPTSRCWRRTSAATRRCPRSSTPPARARGSNRYPDPSYCRCARRRRALRVPAERIALGNGSCDVLLAAGEALLEPGAEVVYAWPAFSVYPQLAASSGARAIQVPLDGEYRHDLDAMLAEVTVSTRLILICNPNNPTSTSLRTRADRGVSRPRAGARLRDPRRGLLRVLARDRRTVRVRRVAAAVAESGAPAHLLQGLRARRVPSGTRWAALRSCGTPSNSCASRSISTSPPRRPRSKPLSTRTPSTTAWR